MSERTEDFDTRSPKEIAQDRVRELEAENKALREVLRKVVAVGHNDKCLFCAFKDAVALDGRGDHLIA